MSNRRRFTASANCVCITSRSGANPHFFTRERAALEWTEVLTKLPEHGVSDDIFQQVRGELSEQEISDLSFAVMLINAWNRMNIGFKTVPGSADAVFGFDKAGLN